MDQMQTNHTEDETLVAISIRLVQTSIKQARAALAEDNLEKAQQFFQEALEVEGEHPDRDLTIRRELKRHSDQLVSEPSPSNWEKAHRSLEILENLGLSDEETHQWRRSLWLRQADYYLGRGNLDQSFEIFRDLMEGDEVPDDLDELKAQISDIVRRNLLSQARKHEWDSLREIIKRFTEIAKPVLPPGDELSEWLETISGTLEAISQADEEAQRELEAEQQRRRLITAVLSILVVIAMAALIMTIVSVAG
jgi:tetratricopeptide (TPR) repeat protein